jgi:hypothetical protein
MKLSSGEGKLQSQGREYLKQAASRCIDLMMIASMSNSLQDPNTSLA